MRTPYTLFMMLACAAGCIAERTIDDIIDAHGVTWLPETTGSDTSTSTGSSTDAGTSSGEADTGTSQGSGGAMEGSASTFVETDDTATGSETSASPDLPSPPQCGDGVVEGDETCDDANDVPDDGCDACAKDSTIFVSSELYQGGEIGGLAKADQRCRGLAAMAGLPRFETYRAWLSSQTISASDRLLHSRGRYVLVNGLVVADDWDDLTSGSLQRPIDVDEHSETQQVGVWTGTLPDGSIAVGSTQCDDWTDHSLGQDGGGGGSDVFDMWWTFVGQVGCGSEAALYCIEQ